MSLHVISEADRAHDVDAINTMLGFRLLHHRSRRAHVACIILQDRHAATCSQNVDARLWEIVRLPGGRQYSVIWQCREPFDKGEAKTD